MPPLCTDLQRVRPQAGVGILAFSEPALVHFSKEGGETVKIVSFKHQVRLGLSFKCTKLS